jgi:hypothetical protein
MPESAMRILQPTFRLVALCQTSNSAEDSPNPLCLFIELMACEHFWNILRLYLFGVGRVPYFRLDGQWKGRIADGEQGDVWSTPDQSLTLRPRPR